MSEKVIEVKAESLEKARAEVKSQTPNNFYLLSEKILSDGETTKLKVMAKTTEEAFEKAQKEIPIDANVYERTEVAAPKEETIVIDVLNEQNAEISLIKKVQDQFGKIALVLSYRLITRGKKGVFGIGQQPDQYEVHILLQSVVEIAYQAKAIISATFSDAVEPLLADLDIYNKQDAAIEMLTKIGAPAVEPLIDILLKARGDPSWSAAVSKASKAAGILGKIGNDRAVEPLIQIFTDFQCNENIRDAAADALGDLKAIKALEPLIMVFQNGILNRSRHAAEAIGKIGSDQAIKVLIAALKDGNERVREYAVRGLMECKDIQSIVPLIESLQDSNRYVRQSAVTCLCDFGNDQAVEPLIYTLRDPQFDVRRAAAEGLGHLKDDRTIPHLISMLRVPEMAIRSGAAKSLGQIGNPLAVEGLIEALENGFETTFLSSSQAAAAEALGMIGDERAVAPLIKALTHSNSEVCQCAKEALAKIGSPGAMAAIKDK